VLAALLLQRGVPRVIATDISPRALAAARANLERMGLADRAQLLQCDLYPEGKADLVVCNPPWIPAKPTSLIEHAIYDPGHRMLLGVLEGARAHLQPGGELWLIMSDLAEHLGLREPGWLAQAIAHAGLKVLGKLDARPTHGKASDRDDPLFEARQREVTSLWRLG
jgi:methylase of polypeptide subunit release factors